MRDLVTSLMIAVGLFVIAAGIAAQWGKPAGAMAAGVALVALGILVHGVGEDGS